LVWQLGQLNLNSFQPFLKLLRVKQPVDSTKQQVVFHLVWKTLYFKKILNTLALDSTKEWITNKTTQIPPKTQQQHSLALNT